jgi:hypothetical protein
MMWSTGPFFRNRRRGDGLNFFPMWEVLRGNIHRCGLRVKLIVVVRRTCGPACAICEHLIGRNRFQLLAPTLIGVAMPSVSG